MNPVDRPDVNTADHRTNPAPTVPYAVWAPNAQDVDLLLLNETPGARHGEQDRWAGATPQAMEPAGGGWWVPSQALLDLYAPGGPQEGQNPGYGYCLDGEGPYPDPRSRWQPDTVHGPSRRVDLDAIERSERARQPWGGRPLQGAVVYELHLGTFTEAGTLDAAVERLPHLVELGITHVELLPVNTFGGDHNWGYDGVGWFAVDASYGGPEAYLRFVDACHAAGLAVLQDVVYNHLGPSGNYLPQFGPYQYAGGTDWGDALNLDGPGSDEVRRYILDNVRMWLEDYGVDGLRLDAVHALADTRAVHLLEEIAALADQLSAEQGRPLTVVAESDLNDPIMFTPRPEGGRGAAGGYGLSGQWSDDLHHALHVALTGETDGYYADFEPLSALAKVLNQGFFHDGTYSSFRNRHHGRPLADDTPAHALVVFAQNHDQIGNRAAGDRLSQSLSEGRLAAAAALLFAGPFTPMLFMGEEWAASTPWAFFTAHREPELGVAVTEGRRREFSRMGWDLEAVPDPQDHATFEAATLDWNEVGEGRHARILQLHRDLARLRAEFPELTDPDLRTTFATVDESARHVRLDRGLPARSGLDAEAAPGQSGTVVLLVALGDQPLQIPEELSGYRLLAGHHDDGPVTSHGEVTSMPRQVPAPGFVLLDR